MEAVHRPAEGISILTHQLGTGLKKTPDALFGEENRGYGPPLVRPDQVAVVSKASRYTVVPDNEAPNDLHLLYQLF